MSKLNYHVLNNSIVIDHDNELYTIDKGDSRYNKILDCIKADDLERIPGIVDVAESFRKAGMDLIDGLVHISGVALPNELSKKIVAFRDLELPTKPLLNFWNNLKTNSSYNSRKMLYAFLEHNGHPLTDDGCFIAYRGVTSDFKDCHTRSFDNSIGAICEVPRDSVDDNPNNTCSSGLHVACHSYAHGFGAKLIKVKVNPVDVVCVPVDYNGTKMRVSKFEVLSECENIDTSELYEHEEIDDVCIECGAEMDCDGEFCQSCIGESDWGY